MTASGEPAPFEFADYFGILRRRWLVVLSLAGVGLVAAAGYLVSTPRAYTATAEVNVTSAGNVSGGQGTGTGQSGAVAGGRTSGAINLDTESQIVKSGTVAAIARHTLHSPSAPGGLVHNVSVTVPANSSVLQISCQLSTADQAAACANAFANGYLSNRRATSAAAARRVLRTMQHRLTALQKTIAQLTVRMNRLPLHTARRVADRVRLLTANTQLEALATQSAAITAQEAPGTGGSVISAATPPSRPSSPQKLLVLPSGLLVGLIIGLIAALTRDRLDRRVKDARDAARFGLPALLSLSGKDMKGALLVPAWSAAGAEFTELARYAAAALGDGNQLLVAGTAAGRGSSVVAANLALAMARAHGAVILVCPDQKGAAELLGLAQPRAAAARGEAEIDSPDVLLDQTAQQLPGLPGLRVLVLGPDLSKLSYGQARQLAAHLRASARYVLVDAPWAARGGDSLTFAEFCDAALLAVEVPRSRHPDVYDCLTRLGRLGVKVIGAAVLPRLPRASRPAGGRDANGLLASWQLADAAGARPGRPAPAAVTDGTDSASPSVPGHVQAADWFSGT